MPRLLALIVLSACLCDVPAHAQTCQEIREIRRVAKEKGEDGPALVRLENRLCLSRRVFRPISPNCEELTTMELLARLEPPKKDAPEQLNLKQRREIAQLRRAICAGNPDLRSPTWSTAKFVVVERDSLYYPHGKRARNRYFEWFYPSGKPAKVGRSKWRYPSGEVAVTSGGGWSLPDGSSAEKIGEVRKRACKMLGSELCFGGKGVDPDLIVAAMMSLLVK